MVSLILFKFLDFEIVKIQFVSKVEKFMICKIWPNSSSTFNNIHFGIILDASLLNDHCSKIIISIVFVGYNVNFEYRFLKLVFKGMKIYHLYKEYS